MIIEPVTVRPADDYGNCNPVSHQQR